MEEVAALQKKISDFFGPAFRAISDRYDHDFPVVATVRQGEEGPVLSIWPHPEKAFDIEIPDVVEETGDRWTFDSPSGRWQFRVLPEAKEFARSFKKAQFYRG